MTKARSHPGVRPRGLIRSTGAQNVPGLSCFSSLVSGPTVSFAENLCGCAVPAPRPALIVERTKAQRPSSTVHSKAAKRAARLSAHGIFAVKLKASCGAPFSHLELKLLLIMIARNCRSRIGLENRTQRSAIPFTKVVRSFTARQYLSQQAEACAQCAVIALLELRLKFQLIIACMRGHESLQPTQGPSLHVRRT
jgi:hypothetical protein